MRKRNTRWRRVSGVLVTARRWIIPVRVEKMASRNGGFLRAARHISQGIVLHIEFVREEVNEISLNQMPHPDTNCDTFFDINKTTNLMELRPSRESVSCAATQELPRILWNPKVHYHVCKSPPLIPTLSQINPVHTTSSYLSKIYFITIHTPPSWSS
jgi:hypothetical protein